MTATTQHMPQFDNGRARIDEFLCKSPSQAKSVFGYSDRDIADAKLRFEFDKKKPETHEGWYGNFAEELMKDAIIRIEERETQKNDDFEMVVPDEQEVEDDDDFQILPANPESTTDEEDDGLGDSDSDSDDETIGDIAATIAKKVKEPAAKKRKRAEPAAKKRKRESAIEKYTWRTHYTEIGGEDAQKIRYKEYAEIDGFAWQLMIRIEKDTYKDQSSATVELFTDGEWKLLDDIMPCNMQTEHTYKKGLTPSHFKEDRDTLEKRARLILM
tara:strand:+ start:5663 stop:6475 length:813 start_codon:yes stop_codon:yes gene_type:complete